MLIPLPGKIYIFVTKPLTSWPCLICILSQRQQPGSILPLAMPYIRFPRGRTCGWCWCRCTGGPPVVWLALASPSIKPCDVLTFRIRRWYNTSASAVFVSVLIINTTNILRSTFSHNIEVEVIIYHNQTHHPMTFGEGKAIDIMFFVVLQRSHTYIHCRVQTTLMPVIAQYREHRGEYLIPINRPISVCQKLCILFGVHKNLPHLAYEAYDNYCMSR